MKKWSTKGLDDTNMETEHVTEIENSIILIRRSKYKEYLRID